MTKSNPSQFRISAWVIAALLGLAFMGAPAAAGENADQRQIRSLIETYQRALNGNDVDGVIEVYAPDGVFLQEFYPTHVGHAAIRRAYEGVFKAIDLNVTFHIIEAKVLADGWAFARTTSDGTIKINATGDRVPNAGQELFLLHKEGGGGWKFARYAFSATAPIGP